MYKYAYNLYSYRLSCISSNCAVGGCLDFDVVVNVVIYRNTYPWGYRVVVGHGDEIK